MGLRCPRWSCGRCAEKARKAIRGAEARRAREEMLQANREAVTPLRRDVEKLRRCGQADRGQNWLIDRGLGKEPHAGEDDPLASRECVMTRPLLSESQGVPSHS